ncbi:MULTISPECIES: hypothetical protein [Butyricimonas]|uniref:hypothetical protein n=1 Tax=Butyricimonas TaxID=574697 RepID=UPI0007FB4BBB|nr:MULTISPECIES: hypothetical protein [Butyricimonas]
MANTYLKIEGETSALEVGVDEGYLKISMKDNDNQTITSILLDYKEIEDLLEFIEKKKKEL